MVFDIRNEDEYKATSTVETLSGIFISTASRLSDSEPPMESLGPRNGVRYNHGPYLTH